MNYIAVARSRCLQLTITAMELLEKEAPVGLTHNVNTKATVRRLVSQQRRLVRVVTMMMNARTVLRTVLVLHFLAMAFARKKLKSINPVQTITTALAVLAAWMIQESLLSVASLETLGWGSLPWAFGISVLVLRKTKKDATLMTIASQGTAMVSEFVLSLLDCIPF